MWMDSDAEYYDEDRAEYIRCADADQHCRMNDCGTEEDLHAFFSTKNCCRMDPGEQGFDGKFCSEWQDYMMKCGDHCDHPTEEDTARICKQWHEDDACYESTKKDVGAWKGFSEACGELFASFSSDT